jgi:hypothetical protein
MRSVVFDGQPLEVHVRDIPKATVVRQTDAVVQVTSAAICGSDLHNYHGVFGSNQVPYPIGHEAMGIVEEIGADVDSVKVGDRVIIPDIPDGVGLDLEPATNLAIAYMEKAINLAIWEAAKVRLSAAESCFIISYEAKGRVIIGRGPVSNWPLHFQQPNLCVSHLRTNP